VSTALVPAEELIPGAARLEDAPDPRAAVIAACGQAKAWLARALEADDVARILELKSQAQAVETYLVQRRMAKDAQLAAAELIRRAERALGLIIRRGQAEGPGQWIRGVGSPTRGPRSTGLARPIDVAKVRERSDLHEIYLLTDGVDDGRFEQAIGEARQEANLSRNNMVRKLVGGQTLTREYRRGTIAKLAAQGYTARQISDRLDGISVEGIRRTARRCGIAIPAEEVLAKTQPLNSDRIVSQAVESMAALVAGLNLVDFSRVNSAAAAEWADALSNSARAVNRFARRLTKKGAGADVGTTV
jgi:hypothetical protein